MVSLDNNTTANTNNGSSQTTSFTCSNTSQDGRLLVGVMVQGTTGLIEQFTVTYGGTSLKRITYIDYLDTGLSAVAVFELVNPSSGTADVVVSTNSGNRYFRSFISSWNNVVDQNVNVFETNTGAYSTPTEPTVDLTTPVNNCVVIDYATRSLDNNTWTQGSNQTILDQGDYGTGFTSHGASSYESVSTASTITMNWTGTDLTGNWGTIAVCLYDIGARMKMIGVDKFIFS